MWCGKKTMFAEEIFIINIYGDGFERKRLESEIERGGRILFRLCRKIKQRIGI
ncbi:MAG: hypothetical protein PHW04_18730 [Candidatus Wallbacteria bacterium]|nr:hypothetical protein [Candidatus Wallbacteria bacterium]